METLYLAVDPDDTEVCSNCPLFRVWDKMIEYSTPEYREKNPIELYDRNQWMDGMHETDYGYYGEDYCFDGVVLPEGTIEKLTGKRITWDDEPIEIKF